MGFWVLMLQVANAGPIEDYYGVSVPSNADVDSIVAQTTRKLALLREAEAVLLPKANGPDAAAGAALHATLYEDLAAYLIVTPALPGLTRGERAAYVAAAVGQAVPHCAQAREIYQRALALDPGQAVARAGAERLALRLEPVDERFVEAKLAAWLGDAPPDPDPEPAPAVGVIGMRVAPGEPLPTGEPVAMDLEARPDGSLQVVPARPRAPAPDRVAPDRVAALRQLLGRADVRACLAARDF